MSPSLRRVLASAIGGVAVGAVVLTAGLTLGLVRATGDQATLAELRLQADRMAHRPGVLRAGPRGPEGVFVSLGAEFVPDGVDHPYAGLDQPEGRGEVDGQEVLYVARRVAVRQSAGTLYVVRLAEGSRGLGSHVARRVLVASLIALAASAAVAYLLSRRISQPLSQLAGAAVGLARGSPPAPEALAAQDGEPSEVADLRAAFAGMSTGLAAARERERTFLLSVSHELRTPLTSIRGYAEALADGAAPDPAAAGRVVLDESRRLERLVGDLMDLARLQSGEFPVEVEEADLAAVGARVVESLRPLASQAEVMLEHRTSGESLVQTDPDRAHQLLANLVENALRVTPAGGTVTVSVDGRSVAVSDTGPGLDPKDVEHVFDRFYLWRRYRGERAVGTGLGLAIVGELARLLDVKITVNSQPGSGTTFTLAF